MKGPRSAFGRADEHPYRRLTADWVKLVVAAVLVALSVRHVGDRTATETSIERFFTSFPEGLNRLFDGILGIGTLWGVGLVVVAAVIAKRWRLALVLASAGAGAWFFARFVGFLTSGKDVGHSITAVFTDSQPGSYPAVHLAVVAAVMLAATPFLSRPVRRLSQGLLTALAVGALVVGAGGVNDVLGALALAWASRLWCTSHSDRPPVARRPGRSSGRWSTSRSRSSVSTSRPTRTGASRS